MTISISGQAEVCKLMLLQWHVHFQALRGFEFTFLFRLAFLCTFLEDLTATYGPVVA
jgi:hypothetical protein